MNENAMNNTMEVMETKVNNGQKGIDKKSFIAGAATVLTAELAVFGVKLAVKGIKKAFKKNVNVAVDYDELDDDFEDDQEDNNDVLATK